MEAPPRDAVGAVHPVVEGPPRIVSLVPSLTELLFDLGLGAAVVGRTQYCVHPADRLAAVPSVGGTKKIRMDRLLALAPTHVLVNIDETPRPLAEAVAAAGIRVIVTHPVAPRDNLALYRLLGHVFRREDEAEDLADRFEAAYARITARIWPAVRVLYLIWDDPWMTVSRDTYIARLLALVGWQTLPEHSETRYPAIGEDDPVWRRAERILFSTEPCRFSADTLRAFRDRRPDIGADLRLIDGEMTSWYGSRAIAALDDLRTVAATLGPRQAAEKR